MVFSALIFAVLSQLGNEAHTLSPGPRTEAFCVGAKKFMLKVFTDGQKIQEIIPRQKKTEFKEENPITMTCEDFLPYIYVGFSSLNFELRGFLPHIYGIFFFEVRFRRPVRGAPKSSGPKVPKKCSPKCFWGPGWECRKKCRKTAENVLEMLKKGGGAHFFGSFSALFPALPAGSPKALRDFGTFGPELFGAPLAGRRNLNL